MKVTNVEKKEKSTVELTIQVEAGEFEAAVQKAYLKNRNRISVPGFRKGKAPRKIIESMYGSGVFYEDAINDVYPGAYEAAVKEQGLEDMGHPVMDIVEVGKDGLTFTALVSVRPEVKLGEYKGLTAEKAEVAISDEDVDNELKPFINRATRMVTVERAAETGDTVVIDFEGFLDGKPFDGRSRPRATAWSWAPVPSSPGLRGAARGCQSRRREGAVTSPSPRTITPNWPVKAVSLRR